LAGIEEQERGMTEASHMARSPTMGQSLKLGCIVLTEPEAIEAAWQYIGRRLAGALATQGARALENPLSSTTVHEAGHAVVHACFGDEVRYSKIWRIKRGSWRGRRAPVLVHC
jgi:hypothetical protein